MNIDREKRRADANRANTPRNGQKENDKVADQPANTDNGDGDED